jgi:hypothetical protein
MTSSAVLLPGGDVVVPGELLADLLFELEAPKQRAPLDVVTPHRSRQIAELVDLTRQGAVAHRQRLRASRESFATLSQTSTVTPWESSVDRHAGLSIGGEVVGVAVASGMLDKSQQWVRVLAASGALPGARKTRGLVGNGRGTARIHWRIPLAAVHAYLQTREGAR